MRGGLPVARACGAAHAPAGRRQAARPIRRLREGRQRQRPPPTRRTHCRKVGLLKCGRAEVFWGRVREQVGPVHPHAQPVHPHACGSGAGYGEGAGHALGPGLALLLAGVACCLLAPRSMDAPQRRHMRCRASPAATIGRVACCMASLACQIVSQPQALSADSKPAAKDASASGLLDRKPGCEGGPLPAPSVARAQARTPPCCPAAAPLTGQVLRRGSRGRGAQNLGDDVRRRRRALHCTAAGQEWA